MVHAAEPQCCPHVDRDDHRCSQCFGLTRIDQAFCVCFGTYRACPLYHQINQELRSKEQRDVLIVVTAHGNDLSLRPTGT